MVACLLGFGGPASGGALSGPILPGLSATIEDVLELPASTGGSFGRARLNFLREVPDGSGRLFVNDLRGPLYVIENGAEQVYMDLSVVFANFEDGNLAVGFASFAFHPDFATNGLFYTVHMENVVGGTPPPNLVPAIPTSTAHHVVLSEWEVDDPSGSSCQPQGGAPNCTRRELMRVDSRHHFHNMGEIAFRPTAQPGDPDYGLLYICNGDYGTARVDDWQQLQRLDTPYGTLMRIDPLGGPFMRGGITYDYGIPADNPFANDGDPDTFDEIYAYGLRNGHRLAWDAVTGEAFLSDIGQSHGEEVNRLVPGANYGWPLREGNWGIDPDVDLDTPILPRPPDPTAYRYPVAFYDHEEGAAIAGGFVYRGPGPLHGMFVFGDIRNGRIFYADSDELVAQDDGDPDTVAQVFELALVHEGQPTTLLDIVRDALQNPGLGRTDLRFGQDASGQIYVTTKQDGFVRRLHLPGPVSLPASAGQTPILILFALLSASGFLAILRSGVGVGARRGRVSQPRA